MIRLILADDHPLMRQNTRRILEKIPDVEIIAEATNGQEAIRLTQHLSPDMLVLDVWMPYLNGLEVTQKIRALGLVTHILILSMHPDETLARQSLKRGATAFLTKYSMTADLPAAIRIASQGQAYLSPSVSEKLQPDSSNGGNNSPKVIIT